VEVVDSRHGAHMRIRLPMSRIEGPAT
jgi:hypothetical protein